MRRLESQPLDAHLNYLVRFINNTKARCHLQRFWLSCSEVGAQDSRQMLKEYGVHARANSCANSCWFFVTQWTVAHQAPLSMGFCRQESWNWVAISSSRGSAQPSDLLSLLHWRVGGFFTTEPPGKPQRALRWFQWAGKVESQTQSVRTVSIMAFPPNAQKEKEIKDSGVVWLLCGTNELKERKWQAWPFKFLA